MERATQEIYTVLYQGIPFGTIVQHGTTGHWLWRTKKREITKISKDLGFFQSHQFEDLDTLLKHIMKWCKKNIGDVKGIDVTEFVPKEKKKRPIVFQDEELEHFDNLMKKLRVS